MGVKYAVAQDVQEKYERNLLVRVRETCKRESEWWEKTERKKERRQEKGREKLFRVHVSS
jgi:hypothetical protein